MAGPDSGERDAVKRLLRTAQVSGGPLLQRLSGGNIGSVWRAGRCVVKRMVDAPEGVLEAEAAGLASLAEAGVQVPEVHWAGPEGIVMAYVEPDEPDWTGLAEQLAGLHQCRAERYGSDAPGFLGRWPTPEGRGSWSEVFVEHRLRRLLDATRGTLGADVAGRVQDALERVEVPTEGPVRVHGDLWSGNLVHGRFGAVLIDPSVFDGERAVDLAMMQLFGGFPTEFWEAYEALLPIPHEVARGLAFHRLYFVLAHVLFFGSAYVGEADRTARSALTNR